MLTNIIIKLYQGFKEGFNNNIKHDPSDLITPYSMNDFQISINKLNEFDDNKSINIECVKIKRYANLRQVQELLELNINLNIPIMGYMSYQDYDKFKYYIKYPLKIVKDVGEGYIVIMDKNNSFNLKKAFSI